VRPPSKFGFGAVLLGIGVAVGSFVLRQYWMPEAENRVESVLASMDFEARDLSVRRYDPNGSPGFDLWAPLAQRQNAEDALTLIDANFVFADGDGEAGWHGQAPQALVNNDGQPLQLLGGVMLEHPHSKTTLHTESMTLDPQARRAWGEQPVRLERVGSVVESEQFNVDLDSDLVSLNGKVRGRFSGHK